MANFNVSPGLSVICFRRSDQRGPFFAVREFDNKVIRAVGEKGRGRGPSEQAIRASIRQAILNMNLRSERASKAEIRLLKSTGILGKRAPSCSLLNAEDMIKLLQAFGKDTCVRNLKNALRKERKTFAATAVDFLDNEHTPKVKPRRLPQPAFDVNDDLVPTPKRRRLETTTKIDTLIFALEAMSEQDAEDESSEYSEQSQESPIFDDQYSSSSGDQYSPSSGDQYSPSHLSPSSGDQDSPSSGDQYPLYSGDQYPATLLAELMHHFGDLTST